MHTNSQIYRNNPNYVTSKFTLLYRRLYCNCDNTSIRSKFVKGLISLYNSCNNLSAEQHTAVSKEKHILRPRRKGSALQLLQKGAHPLQLVSKGLAIGHPVVKEILIEALGARIFVDIVKGHHLKISKIKLHKPAVVHGRIAAEGSQFAASGERAAEYRIKGNPQRDRTGFHVRCGKLKRL